MELETIMQIIYIAVIALSLLSTILTLIVKTTTNKNVKKNALNAYNIVKKIQDLIINAESFVNYSGSEKLSYVITRMKEYAISNKLSISENEITELVENEITLSNEVNTNKKNVSRETLTQATR